VPPLSELVPLPGRGEPQYPDAPFKLRPYQVEAIHKVIQEWKAGVNVQMVMLPTGCGKTVVFAGEGCTTPSLC
jgi:superfamily II DNA or RNA helicase